MAITTQKIAAILLVAATFAVGGAWLTVGLRPFQQAPVEQIATARTDEAANSVDEQNDARRPPSPRSGPPKRGALRIARLKHDGDWNIADQAIPNLMATLRRPPNSFDVVINQKDLFARDPSLIYYPLIYIQGRGPFSLPKEDLDALRYHLEPGGGTLFADANIGSPAFDASFRRFVAELLPGNALVPIPKDDQLYSTKVGFDLSKVEFTKAAGGGRGFPQLDGVKINDHWAIIYSKYDISSALEGKNDIKSKGYPPESARKIACNIVIYATLP